MRICAAIWTHAEAIPGSPEQLRSPAKPVVGTRFSPRDGAPSPPARPPPPLPPPPGAVLPTTRGAGRLRPTTRPVDKDLLHVSLDLQIPGIAVVVTWDLQLRRGAHHNWAGKSGYFPCFVSF
jgi:hypothetical protein